MRRKKWELIQKIARKWTRDILIDFFENGLGLDNHTKEIELLRVHHLGKPVEGKIGPIIVGFLRYQDRERVLRASFRLSRESKIKVLEGYPKEIIERTRKQMPKLKELSKEECTEGGFQ